MQQDKAMKQVISALAEKHGLDLTAPSAHLRLEMKGFDRLVIEKIAKHRLCVAHYFEYKGVLVADPELEFFIDAVDQWWPITINQIIGGQRIYAELDLKDREIVRVNDKDQADVVVFANLWAKNLKDQQWLECANRGELVVPNTKRRFPLGRLLTTAGAQQELANAGQEACEFFSRHQAQDWGELDDDDKRLNDESVNHGSRLLSTYTLKTGIKVWVITEADRSSSTILLPDEY